MNTQKEQIATQLKQLRTAKRESEKKIAAPREPSIDEQIAALEQQKQAIEFEELQQQAGAIQAEADQAFIAFAQSIKTVYECVIKIRALKIKYWKSNPRGTYRELETYGLDIEKYLNTARGWLAYMAGRKKLTGLLEQADIDISIRRRIDE